jgi:hypothetical protein
MDCFVAPLLAMTGRERRIASLLPQGKKEEHRRRTHVVLAHPAFANLPASIASICAAT